MLETCAELDAARGISLLDLCKSEPIKKLIVNVSSFVIGIRVDLERIIQSLFRNVIEQTCFCFYVQEMRETEKTSGTVKFDFVSGSVLGRCVRQPPPNLYSGRHYIVTFVEPAMRHEGFKTKVSMCGFEIDFLVLHAKNLSKSLEKGCLLDIFEIVSKFNDHFLRRIHSRGDNPEAGFVVSDPRMREALGITTLAERVEATRHSYAGTSDHLCHAIQGRKSDLALYGRLKNDPFADLLDAAELLMKTHFRANEHSFHTQSPFYFDRYNDDDVAHTKTLEVATQEFTNKPPSNNQLGKTQNQSLDQKIVDTRNEVADVASLKWWRLCSPDCRFLPKLRTIHQTLTHISFVFKSQKSIYESTSCCSPISKCQLAQVSNTILF